MHGTDVSGVGADLGLRRSLAWSLRQADLVTAVSGWLADLGQQTFGLTDRPTVIGNSVDLSVFFPQGRVDWHATDVTLLHISNF
jgi:hypothetical protein